MLEFGLEATAHGDELVSSCHGQRGAQLVVGAVGIGWAERLCQLIPAAHAPRDGADGVVDCHRVPEMGGRIIWPAEGMGE